MWADESLQQVFTHILAREMLDMCLTLTFKTWFTTRAAAGTRQALGAKFRQQKCIFSCFLLFCTETSQQQA